MARIRTIKPEFWTDEKIVECSMPARLLFIGMWSFADDYGNTTRSSKQLKMQIFPGDMVEAEPLIQELMSQDLLTEYSGGSGKFLHISGFLKHQKIDRPGKPAFPEFSPEHSTNNQRAFDECSTSVQRGLATEGKGRESKGKESNNTDPAKKTAGNERPSSKKDSINAVGLWIDVCVDCGMGSPAVTGPDAKAAQNILKAVGGDKEKLLKVYRGYTKDADPFVQKKGWSLMFLQTCVNKYLLQKDGPDLDEDGWPFMTPEQEEEERQRQLAEVAKNPEKARLERERLLKVMRDNRMPTRPEPVNEA